MDKLTAPLQRTTRKLGCGRVSVRHLSSASVHPGQTGSGAGLLGNAQQRKVAIEIVNCVFFNAQCKNTQGLRI